MNVACLKQDCKATFFDCGLMLLHMITKHPFQYVELKRRGWDAVLQAIPEAEKFTFLLDIKNQSPESKIDAPTEEALEMRASGPMEIEFVAPQAPVIKQREIPVKLVARKVVEESEEEGQILDESMQMSDEELVAPPIALDENPVVGRRVRTLSEQTVRPEAPDRSPKNFRASSVGSVRDEMEKAPKQDSRSKSRSVDRSHKRKSNNRSLSANSSGSENRSSSSSTNSSGHSKGWKRRRSNSGAVVAQTTAPTKSATPASGSGGDQGNKPLVPCLLCMKLYPCSRDAYDHDIASHTKHPRYPCAICRHFFACSVDQLRVHLEESHKINSSTQRLLCPWCPSRPRLWSEYNEHLIYEYTRGRQRLYKELSRKASIRCDTCRREFTDDFYFDEHTMKCRRATGSPARCSCTQRSGHRRGCIHARTFCKQFPACVYNMCDYGHPVCVEENGCKDSNCPWFHENDKTRHCISCGRKRK